MHDFHLASQIVKIAEEYAKKNGLKTVKKIFVELGDVIEHGENISAANLRHNINLLMPCRVQIKKIKGDSWRLVSIEAE